MADHTLMKLGKREPKEDPRTLELADYVDLGQLPAIPRQRFWTQGRASGWGMMGNDTYGDCTCAAAGHAIQVWSLNAGQEVTISDKDVLAAYWGTGTQDDGRYCLDVLNYWRTSGIGGHKIGAYAKVNPKHRAMVHAAMDLFGLLYVGIALPLSAQNEPVWSVHRGPSGAPGSWGGHCVALADYDARQLACLTWDVRQVMTPGFIPAYSDELYAILSPDWVDGTRLAPSGVNLDALTRDLQTVTA